MTSRQLLALRNKSSSETEEINESCTQHFDTIYGALVSVLQIKVNKEDDSHIWMVSVSIVDKDGNNKELSTLPNKAVKELIKEANSLIFGVGDGEAIRVIGSVGLHIFKPLSTKEVDESNQLLN